MATIVRDEYDDDLVGTNDYGYEYEQPTVSIGPLLRNILALIRRNLWLILAIMALFVIGAVVFTMLQTPLYTAQTSVEIANRSEQVLGDEMDASADNVETWDTDRFLNTQLDILGSRALAERVVQRLNLDSDPLFFSSMQVDMEAFESEASRRKAAISMVMGSFTANLPAESRVAQLNFTSADPEVSAKVANAYAAEFIQSTLQRKFDSSSYARTFVQDQLQQARSALEASEQELNNYARQAGLIRARDAGNSESTPSSSVTTSSLLQVNEAANRAQAELVAAQAEWNAERAQPLLSSPAALASPAVQRLLSARSELQAQLETAQERYMADHPTVQRLRSELTNTDEQLTRAATEARNAIRAKLVAAQATESQLRSQVNALEGATLQEQDRSVRYNTLAREADTNRSIYEGLLQRYRELNASAGITASNISVIDAAQPPTSPSSPNPILNLAVGILFGCLVAAAIVFLKDQLDDRVRVPEEVEQKVGLNLLGVIPQIKGEDPVEALADPKSVVSESYSALRSSLLYSTRDGLPELMLVTSAQPSEGKSTTSYAVARSMAQVGKRTLLIDADLRRPSAHRLAGIDNRLGLSNLLVGENTAEEAIVASSTENLFVLPSGPIPPAPAELLSSPRLGALLASMREHFDFIVIDSAPVLGLADSPGLSALADGVLLVIEANRGRGGQLKAAIRRLRLIRPTIVGAVLTKFDPQAAGNTYSTYYQYSYYQYQSDEAATA